jgi:hypothetical protein
MKVFLDKLRNAYQEREQIALPSISRFMLFVNILLVVLIILILYIAPREDIDYHFREEKGAITALSAIFLAIGSGLAGSSFFILEKELKSRKVFWLVSMVALVFFAWDELMQEHEKMGQWIRDYWLGSSQIFRNWNDVVVIIYGIIALIFFVYFLPTTLSYPKFVEILAVAFIFYILHTAIDSLTIERTSASVILEETCKLFSSAYFASAMFIGLLGNIEICCSYPNEKNNYG